MGLLDQMGDAAPVLAILGSLAGGGRRGRRGSSGGGMMSMLMQQAMQEEAARARQLEETRQYQRQMVGQMLPAMLKAGVAPDDVLKGMMARTGLDAGMMDGASSQMFQALISPELRGDAPYMDEEMARQYGAARDWEARNAMLLQGPMRDMLRRRGQGEAALKAYERAPETLGYVDNAKGLLDNMYAGPTALMAAFGEGARNAQEEAYRQKVGLENLNHAHSMAAIAASRAGSGGGGGGMPRSAAPAFDMSKLAAGVKKMADESFGDEMKRYEDALANSDENNRPNVPQYADHLGKAVRFVVSTTPMSAEARGTVITAMADATGLDKDARRRYLTVLEGEKRESQLPPLAATDPHSIAARSAQNFSMRDRPTEGILSRLQDAWSAAEQARAEQVRRELEGGPPVMDAAYIMQQRGETVPSDSPPFFQLLPDEGSLDWRRNDHLWMTQ